MNLSTHSRFLIVFAYSIALAASGGEPVAPSYASTADAEQPPGLPERLSETGLFAAGTSTIHPDNLAFSPQYPLWSDGATKRRWLYLPPGTSIDASRPDAWEFPRGTRLWKEFSHGYPVETRFIERFTDGSWRYATYVWNADKTDAFLAPSDGYPGYAVADAPGGRYDIPSRDDCRACHEGSAVPVLGVSALQLSADRDALVPRAEPVRSGDIDLGGLVAQGLVSNLPGALLENPPRIVASSPTARAALGYLHANCGHCHNDAGPLALLELQLAQEVAAGASGADKALHSLLGKPSEFHLHGMDTRIVPGLPAASVLTLRMHSRDPLTQMPPLGTKVLDVEGIALIEHWIQQDLQTYRSDHNETSGSG